MVQLLPYYLTLTCHAYNIDQHTHVLLYRCAYPEGDLYECDHE